MCQCRRNISLGFTEEAFPQGTHMCYFYSSEEERREIIPSFLASGLKAGERTGYFSRQLPASDLLQRLESLGVDVGAEEEKGHFSLSSTEQTYHPDGVFDPEKMLEKLHAFYADSQANGYAGARVSGEMHWALQQITGADRLLEYETKVNIALKTSPVTAICQYDTRLFDGVTIMEVLRVHPMVVTHGQVVRNPFFSLPDEAGL